MKSEKELMTINGYVVLYVRGVRHYRAIRTVGDYCLVYSSVYGKYIFHRNELVSLGDSMYMLKEENENRGLDHR